MEIIEWKILRKILGPIKEWQKYRVRHNNKVNTHVEKITDTSV